MHVCTAKSMHVITMMYLYQMYYECCTFYNIIYYMQLFIKLGAGREVEYRSAYGAQQGHSVVGICIKKRCRERKTLAERKLKHNYRYLKHNLTAIRVLLDVILRLERLKTRFSLNRLAQREYLFR